MTRAPHRSHRYRVVSRCLGCGVKMLGACGYRNCAATTIYRVGRRDLQRARGCTVNTHLPHNPQKRVPKPPDMIAAARRIFGADLIDSLPLGDES